MINYYISSKDKNGSNLKQKKNESKSSPKEGEKTKKEGSSSQGLIESKQLLNKIRRTKQKIAMIGSNFDSKVKMHTQPAVSESSSFQSQKKIMKVLFRSKKDLNFKSPISNQAGSKLLISKNADYLNTQSKVKKLRSIVMTKRIKAQKGSKTASKVSQSAKKSPEFVKFPNLAFN